jgi:RHS repeat-associated protein
LATTNGTEEFAGTSWMPRPATITQPIAACSYAPGNKRVWRGSWTTTYSDGSYIYTRGTDEITFWSVSGQKLGDYALTTISGLMSEPQFYATETECNYYFGSKLIKNINGWVYSDRLASIGKFYPYGIQRPSATANGTEKFTGYFRDAESGNDYADQRYASPGVGRFITPDRGTGGAQPADPGTWNLYAYVAGDPINRVDHSGNVYVAIPAPGDDGGGGSGCYDDGDDDTCGGLGGSPCFGGNGFVGQPGPLCPPTAGPPQNSPPPPAPPPPPTCFGVLVDTIETDLSFFGSPMATYALAYDFVSDAMQDGINPLLVLAISGEESKFGTGSASQSTQNAFGLTYKARNANGTVSYPLINYNYQGGPGWAGGISDAATTVMNQIAKGNNTVSKLYSGNPGAYCVNVPGQPCSTGAGNVESYFELFGGGNPNNPTNLLWPCP